MLQGRVVDLFSEKAVAHFRDLLNKAERRETLDPFFQPGSAKKPPPVGAEEQPGSSAQEQSVAACLHT